VLLKCYCVDPEPDCVALGLAKTAEEGRGWNIVKDLTMLKSLSQWRKNHNLCNKDWLKFVYMNRHEAKGRSNRDGGGYVEFIDDKQRTAKGLAAISLKHPEQLFAVWFQLCASSEQMAAREKEFKESKARKSSSSSGSSSSSSSSSSGSSSSSSSSSSARRKPHK
jgi:hypothetical protein